MGSAARRESAKMELVDRLDDLVIQLFAQGVTTEYAQRHRAIVSFVNWFHDTYLGDIDFPTDFEPVARQETMPDA